MSEVKISAALSYALGKIEYEQKLVHQKNRVARFGYIASIWHFRPVAAEKKRLGNFLVSSILTKLSISGDVAAAAVPVCSVKTRRPRRDSSSQNNLVLALHKNKDFWMRGEESQGKLLHGATIRPSILLNAILNSNWMRLGQLKAFRIQASLHSHIRYLISD